MEVDEFKVQKVLRVYQEVRIIVVTQTEDGNERDIIVNSVVRPIPVPYEQ